jgi:hypothetical protein
MVVRAVRFSEAGHTARSYFTAELGVAKQD